MQWTSAPNIAGAPLPQRARGYWKARVRATVDAVEGFLERERGQLPPWIAVGLGAGIAAWFGLNETEHRAAFLLIVLSGALTGFALRGGRASRAIGWFCLAAAVGSAHVWLRSERVAAPRLDRPRIVSFTGHVERVEALVAKGDLRLTLVPAQNDLPDRVRVTLPAEGAPSGLAAGSVIQARARLAPPPPMALPGSHDFARDMWFRGIGGVGRAIGEVRILQPRNPTGLDSLRDRLGAHVRAALPGTSGGIATALATGDQNAVGEEDAEAMRRSGLAHLLSVSGLHIAAVVGAAMLLTLKLLALSERVALRLNLVLVAAGAGAIAGIGYTLLTGMQVPTVRSCIAALLVLAGIALGRDAISLRLISVGAIAVMLFRPETLAGASFQFSFAAVTAIVALHSTQWARQLLMRRDEGTIARIGRGILGLLLTGLAVEIALIPFALYHFHKAGLYSVAANLIAIPLTTFVIMPLEAAALLLDLAGLGAPFWWLAGASIDGLLAMAHGVATARGAVITLPAMPVWAFAMMVAGGIWICLWMTSVRWLGAIPFLAGAAGASAAPVPDLLVTNDGRHLAIVEDGAPVLLRERSGDFIRDLMAEASGFDGDPGSLPAHPDARCSRDTCVVRIRRNGREWRLLATRSGQSIDWLPLVRACAAADIVVSDRWLPRGCEPRWLKLDRKALEKTGGVSIFLEREPWSRTVAERIGDHAWAGR